MTPQLWIWCCVLVVLLCSAWLEWQKVQARERKERIWAKVRRAMDDAMDDDHTCGCCGQVSAIRELVTLYDDAAVCCLGCADLLNGRTMRQEMNRE